MAEINKVSSVNPITASQQHEKLQQRQTTRKMMKEHQLDEHNKSNKEQEENFAQIAAEQYFPKGPEKGSLQQTREVIPPSLLELYEGGLTDAELAANAADFSYLSSEEIESFLDFIDIDGKKKNKFEELSQHLINGREGEEEGLIDNAARTVCGNNKSEIYLMLCYLLEDLVRKKAKEKLQDRLKKIIDAFERQESAYLFSFFSFQNILKSSPNAAAQAGLLDKMANISSGHVKLNSLRQSLQFVAQSLPDKDMYKMVSLFMKFQAKGLKKISTLSEGRENKEELASILQQERNLIILNSIYNQCKKIFFHLKKVTPIEEKYSDFMAQIITVIESSVVSLDGLQNMEKSLGIKQITLQINKTFVKNFLVLMTKMPQPIFYNESMREKLLESLKNIMRQIEKILEPSSSGLSFLRNKSLKKGNI